MCHARCTSLDLGLTHVLRAGRVRQLAGLRLYCATLTLEPTAVCRPCRCASCAHAGCVHPARRGCERCGCSAELDVEGERICFCDTCRVLGCSHPDGDASQQDAGGGGGAAGGGAAAANDNPIAALAPAGPAPAAAGPAPAADPDPMAPCTHCGCMTSINWKGGRRPALLWEEGGAEEPRVTLSAAVIATHGAAITALTLSHCGSLHDSTMSDILRVIGEGCPKLSTLDLTGCYAQDWDLAGIGASFPQLTALKLGAGEMVQ